MAVSRRMCYLCGSRAITRLPAKVRDKTKLRVLRCLSCGLVFLSSFKHIDADFYQAGQMHKGMDSIKCDAWIEETKDDDARRIAMVRNDIRGKKVMDYGCGAGGFLMQARKTAEYLIGVEPQRLPAAHLRRIGVPVHQSLSGITDRFDVVTLFHVLEHVPDPAAMLCKLSDRLAKGGFVIVEVPNANDVLLSLYKNKAYADFIYWSCHLYVFSEKTLSMLAHKAGFEVDSFMQVQRYPLSNHLYWLAQGKPGGHTVWDYMDNKELNAAYQRSLAAVRGCDTIVAKLRIAKGKRKVMV